MSASSVVAECVGGPIDGKRCSVSSSMTYLRVPVRPPLKAVRVEESEAMSTRPAFDVHFYVVLRVPGLQTLLVYAGPE